MSLQGFAPQLPGPKPAEASHLRQRIATLEATNRVLEQEKTQLQHCLQRSVEITPQRLERLLLTGTAEMLPYETLQTVVKVAYGPEYVPSVGHLGALVNHTGTIAGLILTDERVTSAFQAAACDEIFFHQQPILTVVEPETMAIGAQVEKILYTPKRASSLVESVNSKLRTVQYIKKQVSQEYLWLLALKHNLEPFAHGKRQGHSPFELLGIDLGTNDWVDLVRTYQP